MYKTMTMNTLLVCVCFFTFLFGVRSIDDNSTTNDTVKLGEFDLHKNLFEQYNPNVMPRANASSPICVSIEMFLLSVDEINEKQQTIRIRAFLEMKWMDSFLNWNLDRYSSIERVSVRVKDIWTPDLVLQDSFGKLGELGYKDGNAVVENTGMVTVWPYSTYTVACRMSIVQFPFDEQKCSFIFLSWTNTASVLKLKNASGKVTLERYSESGEWKLLDGDMHYQSSEYEGEQYDKVSFDLHLRRKPLYYVMNVMIPVLSISLLNLFCFLLPSEDGERVTLSISIFLTLAVFLTIVNSTMPESSDEVSKFSIYVGLQLFGNALTIAVTTVSLYLFHRSEKRKIPTFFKLLVKITCTLPEKRNVLFRLARNMTSIYSKPDKDKSKLSTGNHVNEEDRPKTLTMPHIHTGAIEVPSLPGVPVIEDETKITWRMVSVAMDRFCLVGALSWHVVLIVTLIGTIAN